MRDEGEDGDEGWTCVCCAMCADACVDSIVSTFESEGQSDEHLSLCPVTHRFHCSPLVHHASGPNG